MSINVLDFWMLNTNLCFDLLTRFYFSQGGGLKYILVVKAGRKLEILIKTTLKCQINIHGRPLFFGKNPPWIDLLGPGRLLDFEFFLVQVLTESIITGFLLHRAYYQ